VTDSTPNSYFKAYARAYASNTSCTPHPSPVTPVGPSIPSIPDGQVVWNFPAVFVLPGQRRPITSLSGRDRSMAASHGAWPTQKIGPPLPVENFFAVDRSASRTASHGVEPQEKSPSPFGVHQRDAVSGRFQTVVVMGRVYSARLRPCLRSAPSLPPDRSEHRAHSACRLLSA